MSTQEQIKRLLSFVVQDQIGDERTIAEQVADVFSKLALYVDKLNKEYVFAPKITMLTTDLKVKEISDNQKLPEVIIQESLRLLNESLENFNKRLNNDGTI